MFVKSQDKCGSELNLFQIQQNNPTQYSRIAALENNIQSNGKEQGYENF
jgi:hypothetical protein